MCTCEQECMRMARMCSRRCTCEVYVAAVRGCCLGYFCNACCKISCAILLDAACTRKPLDFPQSCGCLPEQAVHPTGPDRVAARRALPRPAMPKKIVDELFIIAPSVVSPLHLQAGNGAPFDGPWAPPHARPAPAQAPAVRRLQSAPAVRHKPPPPQPQGRGNKVGEA